jgi:hypothetical protein
MNALYVASPNPLRSVLSTTARLLTFRATREELVNLGENHLLFGLLCTWIVGIGRYWDNPRVGLLQHVGIGSVIYIFVLALLLWLIIWPLRPQDWTYFRVLTFISLVSPPAILYAIPVQFFSSLDTANTVNGIFLALVATWRIALLLLFLARVGRLDPFSRLVAALLPLSLIVVVLTLLNLERVVFDFMAGFVQPSPNDDAYIVLVWLTYISVLIFIPLLLCYFAVVAHRWVLAPRQKGVRNQS